MQKVISLDGTANAAAQSIVSFGSRHNHQRSTDESIIRAATKLLEHRRPTKDGCNDPLCLSCREILAKRIADATNGVDPIQIIMPSFASKSSLRANTLQTRADMAERLAIKQLGKAASEVGEVYGQETKFVIASDAWLFQPLRTEAGFNVTVEQVEQYLGDIRQFVNEEAMGFVDIVTPRDFYPNAMPGEELLNCLLADWEQRSPEEVVIAKKESGSSEPEDIQRYWARDFLALDEENGVPITNKQRKEMRDQKRRAEPFASRAMQATSAWSNLLASKFPNAIRASIHPKCLHRTGRNGNERFGIKMFQSPPERTLTLLQEYKEPLSVTPWRGTWLMDRESGVGTVVRNVFATSIAGSEVIYDIHGNPSHYEF